MISSCSKLILTGEHSVVYDKPAIALPVKNIRSYVQINNFVSKKNNIKIFCEQLKKNFKITDKKRNKYHPIETTILNFINKYDLKINNELNINIESLIPISSGMGSGASISISLIKALANKFNIKINEEELFENVMEIEKLYHGKPSGIDPTVIIYEKPLLFIRNKKKDFIDIKNKFNLIIVNSGKKASTKNVVNALYRRREKNPKFYNKIIEEIGELSLEIHKLLINKNNFNFIGEFAELIDYNQKLLKKLGVSNNLLDELIIKLNNYGTYASKLSGSGKGGIIFGLIDKDNKKISEKLNQEKIENFILEIP